MVTSTRTLHNTRARCVTYAQRCTSLVLCGKNSWDNTCSGVVYRRIAHMCIQLHTFVIIACDILLSDLNTTQRKGVHVQRY